MYREKYQSYIQLIESRLSPKRFLHSMNVAKAGVELACRYGGDAEKAYLAGILHDIMKEEKPEIQLQMLKKHDIMIDVVTLGARPLWHAKTGAIYCQEVLKINDQDLLNAISYHTTGRSGMSQLEKLVFLADYIGEERDYKDVDIMRTETRLSMERGMRYALAFSIRDLVDRNKLIHPDTVEAYNDVLSQLNER